MHVAPDPSSALHLYNQSTDCSQAYRTHVLLKAESRQVCRMKIAKWISILVHNKITE